MLQKCCKVKCFSTAEEQAVLAGRPEPPCGNTSSPKAAGEGTCKVRVEWEGVGQAQKGEEMWRS